MFPTSIPSQWPLLWIPTCCNWDVNVMLRPALRRWLGTLRMAIHVPCHTCHASKIHDWQLDWDRRVFHDRGSIPYGMPVLRWQPCWCQKPIDAIDARGKIWWDDKGPSSQWSIEPYWTILDLRIQNLIAVRAMQMGWGRPKSLDCMRVFCVENLMNLCQETWKTAWS